MSENVEKELPEQIQDEEEEDSGDDEDLGKYMIDDDDDLPPPASKNVEEKKIDIEDQKKELFSAKELRDYMAASVPGLKKHRGHKLPVHGNERTMNLNHMVLANITESAYFRCDLLQIKTYDEMIDEIYYKVTHLEPWEKGSRKHFTGSATGGERGMAYSSIPGVQNYVGVRGVGQGGIVSTPFCCLYKLWTIKLTRKQVELMCDHVDSPFIRGLGFLYLRFSLPPQNLLEFLQPYFNDQEEVDPKAGGGDPMTMGNLIMTMLEENHWYGTMLPRIPAKHLQEIKREIDNFRGKNSSRGGIQSVKEKGRGSSRRSRSRSPTRKKRRDPRELDDGPSSSYSSSRGRRDRNPYEDMPRGFGGRSSRY